MTKTVSTKAQLGIPGLDDILLGGLRRNRLFLIEGQPGSGKTTLALQFLLEGARVGEKGLYITLSETEEELRETATSHGWALGDGIEIFELVPAESLLDESQQQSLLYSSDLELGETTKSIFAAIERSKPQRVIIDSLSEIRLLAQSSLRYRRQILACKHFFSKRNTTVLLLDDMTAEADDKTVHSVAHGVIRLEELAPDFGAERRRLRVMKYRGQPYRGGYHDFTIKTGGVHVFPRLVAAEHRTRKTTSILTSGNAEFDKLMGGGIESGSSTLVIGPAGTGKSLIVLTMAAAAIKRGERAALFAFDEELGLLFHRAKGMGFDLEALRDSGNLLIEQMDAAEVSPGEFAHNVRSCVEKDGIKTVIIDSLNGYQNSMPQEQFLILHMHELLQYLNRQGAATFLTVAQHGLVGDTKSPVDVTYLADSVLLLRYFEAVGQVRRAISVLKKRTGAHENAIREFTIGKNGLSIGRADRHISRSASRCPPISGRPRSSDGRRSMNPPADHVSERVLILARHGRDALIAAQILTEGGLVVNTCKDLQEFVSEIERGAAVAVLTEETIRDADIKQLAKWVGSQPPWSDFPFVLLTERGGGVERNPAATRQMELLGNVAFLERPFHPTTFVSVVKTSLRGRRRQYEARSHLEALHESEIHARSAESAVRALNDTLEARVSQRTGELEAANRQLISQIEERERVEATLRQMQRLEAVGQLTSGVAHDFNNLLTVVLGNIGFMEKELVDASVKTRQRLSYMRLAAERGSKLTQQLLAFARRQRLEPQPIDINQALANMRDLLQSSLGGSVQINTIFRPGVWWAMVDPTQIELVVLNLAINARDAMEVGGSVTLETANATRGLPERPEEPPPGEYVVISVTDTGTGMPLDVLAKVFEPFFTTKEIGKGSGLGLSQVLGFAKQTGGGMRIDTRVGEGTSVKVYLPRAAPTGVQVSAPSMEPVHHRKGAMILLLDDDEAVREVTASLLRDLGYVVLEVGSGAAALDLLERNKSVDLALLDFAMPGMNGVDVAKQMNSKYPALRILFITGYADQMALEGIGDARIVKKPFAGDELASKVHAALQMGPRSTGNVVPISRLT